MDGSGIYRLHLFAQEWILTHIHCVCAELQIMKVMHAIVKETCNPGQGQTFAAQYVNTKSHQVIIIIIIIIIIVMSFFAGNRYRETREIQNIQSLSCE